MEISEKQEKILGSLLVVSLFLGMAYQLHIQNVIGKEGIYSIAVIDQVEAGRGGFHYDCHYSYRGQRIDSHGGRGIGKEDIGKRYYVRFLKDTPDGQSILYTSAPVSDSIKEAPYEGWTSLPECRTE